MARGILSVSKPETDEGVWRRNPTDAVNVSQLSSLAAGFQSQVGGLQSQINNNDRKAKL
jgi:hypothetical protein